MKVTITLPDEVLKKVDKKAEESFISRSAWISSAIAFKLQSDDIMDLLPVLVQQQKELLDKDIK